MPKGNKFFAMFTLFAIGMISLVGCSGDGPLQSITNATNVSDNQGSLRRGQADVELYGRVATIDPDARTMTLTGQVGLIEILSDAQVVFKGNGSETPIALTDINVNDSVEVRGVWQPGDLFEANRVRVRPNDDNGNDAEFGGRVESIDPEVRIMMVSGFPNLITVASNAEIVQKDRGVETPIELSGIMVGDSVEIKGIPQADGSVLATRVRLRLNMEDVRSDLEFTSAIASIDYTNGTFTVEARSETITTDDNTSIFKKSEREGEDHLSTSGDDDNGGDDNRWKEPIAFTELAVGDLVEVHANFVDGSTLYAVTIEQENGGVSLEVEFKDIIQTIDAGTGTVTFENNSWTGTVLESAVLLGLSGEALTLADFSAGEIVEVHGFQTAEGQFDIVMMEKDNNL